MAEIPPLPGNTILLLEIGSTAHGTGLDNGEDHDELAIVIETERQCLSPFRREHDTVMHRTQPEGTRSGPGDTDRTIMSLRKFVRLAADGNPSMLTALWGPVLQSTPLGDELVKLRSSFIGRHMVPRFRGYAQGQALRLLGLKGKKHGHRGGGGRHELIEAHGWDTKFGMHTTRLRFQCGELLTTRNLRLPMTGWPGEWLRAVRRGEISFEEWWEQALYNDKMMRILEADESLPADALRGHIEQWCIKAHTRYWWETPVLG